MRTLIISVVTQITTHTSKPSVYHLAILSAIWCSKNPTQSHKYIHVQIWLHTDLFMFMSIRPFDFSFLIAITSAWIRFEVVF